MVIFKKFSDQSYEERTHLLTAVLCGETALNLVSEEIGLHIKFTTSLPVQSFMSHLTHLVFCFLICKPEITSQDYDKV